MRTTSLVLAVLGAGLLAVVPACGADDDAADDDDDVTDGDGGAGADADPNAPDGGGTPGEFATLITGDWSIPPGETYRCVYKTIETTVYANAFRPIIPQGTHHTVLTMGDPTRADGITTCNAGTNYDVNVFGSGVGTNALDLPDGIGVKLPAGQQLLLNLHLYNLTDGNLAGTSGTEFIAIAQADVDQEAEAIMFSKFNLIIGTGISTKTGSCNFTGEGDILSVGPHMHQLGTHMKVVAHSSTDGNITIHDGDYSFDEQVSKLLSPKVHMMQGDALEVFCTYNNTTGGTVYFGDSSEAEMCIAGIYRAPALYDGIFCMVEGPL